MTTTVSSATQKKILYPTGDGKPVAETFDHLYALLITLEVLRQYLAGQQATVLGNQFMYYAKDIPKLRVAPDVMVIFDVAPGGRDNYKIWEEGSVPSVIFEMTSASTREKDDDSKYELYENLGVTEYWQFDPKAEWIEDGLRGYRLSREEIYIPITDNTSRVLGLRLAVNDSIIDFYTLDTGEKLLIPDELRQRADQEAQRADREAQRADQAEAELKALKAKLKAQGIELDL
ncbi:MAG: Uma2 family endonuclease [Cyanobacteria bacterium P01_D01_bin.156]